ncbi:MAG: enoyl-CoA hydratase-related protein [Bradymonadaceae bacterium]
MVDQPDSDTIRLELDSEVCTVVLDRPDALNSLNGELVDYLWHTFRQLRSADDVRAVVLTGAGNRAFCAGADLDERSDMTDDETRERLADYRGAFRAVSNLPKPVICAINGYALGGGLELSLACDLRIVDETAEVGLTETRLGIIPGAGGTQRLPRLIGAAHAKKLIFTGDRISGERAAEIGIAVESTPEGEAAARAHELAARMAESAPIAVAQAKRALDAGMQTDLETGLEIESRAYEVTLPTRDRQEGLEAFAEGREPEFKGE